MGRARGTVEAEVAGQTRRLRMSLKAVDEIETRLDGGFIEILQSINNQERVRFGAVLACFEELCRAGGTPLSTEDIDALMVPDLMDMSRAINEAALQSGLIEESKNGDGSSDPTKPGTDPSPSPGDDGRRSPSES